MILKATYNLPVAAPSISDMDEVLIKFRTWRNTPSATRTDLFNFLTIPSIDRQRFLKTLERQTEVRFNAIVLQKYS